MQRDQLKALLAELGVEGDKYGRYPDSGDNIQFCCPWHGETRPSCGIHIYDEYGKCFACGEHFNLAKLVAHQLGFTYPNGEEDLSRGYRWLEEKYNVDMRQLPNKKNLRLIEDEEEDLGDDYEESSGRHEIKMVEIAPFQSGKATHPYYFSRGFTKEAVRLFKIGWDEDLLRVTMPIFWGDGALFGVIGRAILNPKLEDGSPNPEYKKVYRGENFARYYIYDRAPIGEILYPLNLFKFIPNMKKTAILVEGQMDSQWLYINGYTNVLSCINSKITYNKKTGECKQRDLLLELGVEKLIFMFDDDEAGKEGIKHNYDILKDDFTIYGVKYPEGKTDPQMLTKKEMRHMFKNKFPLRRGGGRIKLKRID